jgi:hypothetical protein
VIRPTSFLEKRHQLIIGHSIDELVTTQVIAQSRLPDAALSMAQRAIRSVQPLTCASFATDSGTSTSTGHH